MKFDLYIDGKVYNVELGIGNVITIDIDGKTFFLKTKKTSNGLKVNLDKKEFIVRFEGSCISIDGHIHAVEVHNLRRGRSSWYYSSEEAEEIKDGKPAHKVSGGEGIIQPPMPGRVISIKVKKGDSVKTGFPILVLEAKKMQNEITSNMDGVVREIRVSEGDLVESGDILVVIGN